MHASRQLTLGLALALTRARARARALTPALTLARGKVHQPTADPSRQLTLAAW